MMLYLRDGDTLLQANAVYGPLAKRWQKFATEAEARKALGLPPLALLDALREQGITEPVELDKLAAAVTRVDTTITKRLEATR